jgi:shikimate kinase
MRYVFLVGLMGSGKTHWGRMLAKALNFAFVDTDDLIAHQTGSSIASLFANKGEDHFRQLETELLKYGLPGYDAVISTGGGMPCFNQNIDLLLEKGVVVWLSPDLPTIAERIWRNKEKRPLIAHCENLEEVMEKLNDLMEQRRPFYSKADIVENQEAIDLPILISRIETVGKFAVR